jgi:antitoxin MazE
MYIHQRRSMRLRLRKWGNSLALRIPAAFARETGIEPGAEVDLTLDDGRLVITPLRVGPISLAELLDGVTEENRHDAVEPGTPQGRETW